LGVPLPGALPGTNIVGGVSAIATMRSSMPGSNVCGQPVLTFGFRLSKPWSLKALTTRRSSVNGPMMLFDVPQRDPLNVE
jgi:hypothetical protein